MAVAVVPKPFTTNICPIFCAVVIWPSMQSIHASRSAAAEAQGPLGVPRSPSAAEAAVPAAHVSAATSGDDPKHSPALAHRREDYANWRWASRRKTPSCSISSS